MVKTGTVGGAGTNSKISCTLQDAHGSQVSTTNLDLHGKMGSGHDYFESGNLYTFTVDTTCMDSPVCFLKLSSDGSGYKPGWYVDYVQVLTTKGSQKAAGDNILFDIYGWFTTDQPPYLLTRTFHRCPPVVLPQITDAII
ncbi:Plat domain-containing protein [Thalictrum thalictroides]|uniref:Plat domain-containing protein n=1 Tax=Thalictrum thalictroides TaxID=46969 RepID=A0A7J6WYQ7_THATH|nr:Plat domain-containing protein [Thalictrum thalictroides]